MLQFNAILHPTDFSEHSRYAFRLACSMARDHQARLIILHVVASLGPEFVPLGEGESQLQPEGYQQRLLNEIRALSPPADLNVQHLLAEGDPVEQILQTAEETGCDLIVLGTHGHTGLKHFLMGSTAEQVMRKASCPVLTVKSPQQFASDDSTS